MNLHAEVRSTVAALPQALKAADYQLSYAEGEDDSIPFAGPSAADVKAITQLAQEVGELGDTVLVTIGGHRSEAGEGFRPAHFTLTVSLVNPEAS